MRIDISNVMSGTFQEDGQITSGAKAQQGSAGGAIPVDTATLSSAADAHQLTAQALQSASERSMRVDSLRASVASGNYPLDPESIATSLLAESE